MRYLTLVPAAAMVIGILVGHVQSERQVTANGSPAAFATSQVAPASPVTAAVYADVEAGSGGDGAVPARYQHPAPSETTVATVEDEADSNPPQSSLTVTQALLAEPTSKGSAPNLSNGELEAAIAAAFPPSEQATAYRVAMCESGGDTTKIGAAGEEGAFQVRPEFWGAVPSDIYGQASQAAGIVAEAGWSQWSCY